MEREKELSVKMTGRVIRGEREDSQERERERARERASERER